MQNNLQSRLSPARYRSCPKPCPEPLPSWPGAGSHRAARCESCPQQNSCEPGSPSSPTKAADLSRNDNNNTDCVGCLVNEPQILGRKERFGDLAGKVRDGARSHDLLVPCSVWGEGCCVWQGPAKSSCPGCFGLLYLLQFSILTHPAGKRIC